MTLSLTIIIVTATAIVSFIAMDKQDLKYKLAFSPYEVKHSKQYFKYFSHMFIHADIAHLLFNMFSLYFVGQYLEFGLIQQYGLWGGEFHYFILYFLGGFFATFWPMIRNHNNPSYLSLGASGAVSSILFAFILWNPQQPLSLLFIPVEIPAYIFGPIYLAFEFWAFKRNKTNIAHDAHIGGALFGIVYILIINFDKGKQLIQTIFQQ